MKEKTADEMFEELGYEKEERYSNSVEYIGEDEDSITFINGYEFDDDKCIRINKFNEYITMEELQAINKKCKEMNWI